MTETEKKVPELRFNGFFEDWEQRRLIEMANFRRGSFPQPYGEKKWYDDTNGMPFVQVVDVGNNLKLVNNTKQKISELAQPKSVFVEAGKVVVTLQGSIGRVAITQYPSYVDRTLLIFESYKRPIDEYYFAYVIQQLFEIEKRTAPGGTIKTITKEVLSDFLINIPEFNEQKTLGNFFKQLDDTIALHQRKLVLIKRLKQTYLDALFPQNDGYIPALRFAGFSEPWEQRKVDDLSEETFGGGTPKTGTREYWQGELPWIQSSDLKNEQLNNVKPTKFITDEAIKKSAAKVIPSNSIAIVTRVGVGKLALMPFPYATSQDFFSLSRLKVDPWFAIYRLYKLIQREINNIQGTSIKGMTKADLLDKNVQIPLCSGEQEKIGVIFKQLDNTIVLHQCRLEKLTALKNVLLGKMFL